VGFRDDVASFHDVACGDVGPVRDLARPLADARRRHSRHHRGVFRIVCGLVDRESGRGDFGQEACRDTEALRRSLAVEIRRSVRLLCQAHEAFTHAKAAFRRGFNLPDARDVAKLTSRVHPIVYPATADRIGRLGHPLAEWVVTFYANVKDIQFAGEITAPATTRNVAPQDLDGIVSLLEGTCRNALPLLEQLPPDDGDADLRAEIEAMGHPPPAASQP
jgi:hypothetical protein